MLAARDDGEGIGAGGKAVMRVFCAITYLLAVNADLTVNGVRAAPDSA